jgi:hypothetical protein
MNGVTGVAPFFLFVSQRAQGLRRGRKGNTWGGIVTCQVICGGEKGLVAAGQYVAPTVGWGPSDRSSNYRSAGGAKEYMALLAILCAHCHIVLFSKSCPFWAFKHYLNKNL